MSSEERDLTGASDAPIEQPLSPGEGEVKTTIPAEEIPQAGGEAESDDGEGDEKQDQQSG